MNMRHHARALVALAAAYAVVLQTLLLAIAGPLATGTALAGQPICAHVGAGGAAPAGHAGGCVGACCGCCCGPPVCPTSLPAMTYAPAPAQTIAVVRVTGPHLIVGTARAHRSRAPPLA